MITGSFSLGLLIGFIMGALLIAVVVAWMINREKLGKLTLPKFLNQKLLVAALIALGSFALAFHPSHVILAQATPVPLVIPLSDIFTQANNWLQTLSPIESLAIGITIALAVFGFLYKAIKSAFG